MVKLNSVAAMTFPLVLSLAFPMISLAQSASAGPQDLLIDKLQQ
jgi:hypothetical protein